MQFCPNCANLLSAEDGPNGQVWFVCPTCPYIYTVTGRIVQKVPLIRKKVDDVLGTEESMANAPKTTMCQCPRCGNREAFHFEMQTRSADEPSTHFYKCTKCHLNWKE
ncbi:putative DNA-directed RNA polymerase III subunit RPC10 [Blattamonas nauphoetae]|uniref:DNA-directed RNA polymerase subunit n=1 Tax=Blattamonas nauphoetae TaxID=2049346 RepID=A0ABQ9XSJ2_9EUKA|nr:putative DNA-directed RNA polymerase III subunit RPC10 [Blattamonas nauphoetae]